MLSVATLQAQQQPRDQWPNYHHNSNFSSLTQITPANVSRLTEAWRFRYGIGDSPSVPSVGLDDRFQVQPLHIGGVLYISTPASERHPGLASTVTALEPETGTVVWQYKSPRNVHGRGLAYWKGSGTIGPRLYFGTDKGYLVALELTTGKPAAGFGNNGEVDAYVGVVSPEVGESRRDTYTLPNPVTVYKNLIITGARPGENPPPQPRGDVRAWDAATGKLVWTFHTVPQPGEPNHEDWPADTWKDRSGCNVYSNLTADESTGLVFGATGEANKAVSPGRSLYCNSIIALEGDTGQLTGLKAGVANIGGNIATASGLVFIGATIDRKLRAFDSKTGKELWVTDLPANAHATPITYMGKDGSQYVVIAAAGGGPAARNQPVSDALIAYKLPR